MKSKQACSLLKWVTFLTLQPMLPSENRQAHAGRIMTLMDDALLSENIDLTKRIKQEAHNLGFTLVGITSPEPPAHLDVFSNWLQAGMHGDMAYLATTRAMERRADPRMVLPDCQSIIVVGLNCLPMPQSGNPAPEARIAAYARGDDYHQVLTERLQELVTFIEAQIDATFSYKVYTDTGPLLERELAQRAGLGWIGKNTCLINPQLGSHFLIGELLLSLPLTLDAPFVSDHCGSCTRCIDSCPTQCILADRTIDARRCISYLTIEQRGEIALPLRAQMGNWVFGCDVCQDVCPWNMRFAQPTQDIAFQPRPILEHPTPTDLLSLSVDDFRDSFKNSPFKRPQRAGVLRNAAIAAGNSQDQRSISALAHLLQYDEQALVRGHVAWALGEIGGSRCEEYLRLALKREQNLAVKEEIKLALGRALPEDAQ
ncbi:MAG: tRNA epoxyqueuosine(34) reductase QueG [Chloroflexi bacterium]|nr:tRNA epoxyqueuosine(34) reductase QueG [Chloroflexota bacterium]